MAQISVEQFARELGLQPTILLEQLKAAGVKKIMTEDALTEQDKTQLLEYLRKTHGASEAKNKITLTHRQTTEIRKSDSTGRPRTIQIEVRKKRVLQKTAVAQTVQEAPSPVDVPSVKTPTVSTSINKENFAIDAEELALREAEARKQAELIARQTEEIKLKKARKKLKPQTARKKNCSLLVLYQKLLLRPIAQPSHMKQ